MSNNLENRWSDPTYLEDLRSDRGHTEVAADWPWTEATVRRDRARLRSLADDYKIEEEVEGKVDVDPDGGKFTNIRTDKPITDWTDIFKQFNLDPTCFKVLNDTVRMSKWQQSRRLDNGDRDTVWLFSYSANFVRVHGGIHKDFEEIVAKGLRDVVNINIRSESDYPTQPVRFFVPSDLQLGKVDAEGGVEVTLKAFHVALEYAVSKAIQHHTDHVYIVDPGDSTEGFNNVDSQRQTNCLTITQQVELVYRLFNKAIKAFRSKGMKVSLVTVPSNHCQVRVAKKSLASTPNDDYGILVNKQLEMAFEDDSEVEFIRPSNDFSETAVFNVEHSDTRVAVIHGHQTRSQVKIGDWWRGQDHGRKDSWDADILITGHWHSFMVQHSGDARWILTAPSLEPSSAWFSGISGESSKRGALHFTVNSGQWHDLEIV